MTISLPRACVIGWPVKHSRSPLIHGFWLSQLGLAGEYGLAEVAAEQLTAFLAEMPASGYLGGNVTVPHKEAAFVACAHLTDRAKAIGAVNTLWFEADGLHGDNTDTEGFAKNLDDFAPQWTKAKVALVLGAGGAARGVLYALLNADIEKIILLNRSIERAEALAEMSGRIVCAPWSELGHHLLQADLLINTTSLGMSGQPPLDLDLKSAKPGLIVNDIVYVPLETPLLAQARALGLVAVDGLGMLLHQAVPGFARWFGQVPKVTPELRAYMLRQIEAA